jgi:hypothetical protein
MATPWEKYPNRVSRPARAQVQTFGGNNLKRFLGGGRAVPPLHGVWSKGTFNPGRRSFLGLICFTPSA